VRAAGRTDKKGETSMFLPFYFGGDEQDRTAGLLNAIQALSQLSYTPVNTLSKKRATINMQIRNLSIDFLLTFHRPSIILRTAPEW
jgi:hypothetical protein